MTRKFLLPMAALLATSSAFAQQTLDEQLMENAQRHGNSEIVFPQVVPLAGLHFMFTEQERQAINHALSPDLYTEPAGSMSEEGKPLAPGELQLPPPLFLAGMSYEGPETWSLWLNDTRLRSGHPIGEFEIVSINRHGVELIWKPVMYRGIYHFVLRPRQTFLPDQDAIVDGDARAAADTTTAGAPTP
ncbi:MAG TPA: hypothetical protein DCW68_03755 [Rhodospirillaceae bacterium]|nr:MAG: hypothetical protein A2018_07835 [Alphaproteobacteria bacterium GWF2_58_20]HAU29209.1 hypothetical protein [Rhodospirillaceae bacterium]